MRVFILLHVASSARKFIPYILIRKFWLKMSGKNLKFSVFLNFFNETVNCVKHEGFYLLHVVCSGEKIYTLYINTQILGKTYSKKFSSSNFFIDTESCFKHEGFYLLYVASSARKFIPLYI